MDEMSIIIRHIYHRHCRHSKWSAIARTSSATGFLLLLTGACCCRPSSSVQRLVYVGTAPCTGRPRKTCQVFLTWKRTRTLNPCKIHSRTVGPLGVLWQQRAPGRDSLKAVPASQAPGSWRVLLERRDRRARREIEISADSADSAGLCSFNQRRPIGKARTGLLAPVSRKGRQPGAVVLLRLVPLCARHRNARFAIVAAPPAASGRGGGTR